MTIVTKTRASLAVALMMTTAGCLGSGSGGTGGGAGGSGDPFVDYDTAYASATAATLANAPTSDMPISGNGTYSGAFKLTDIRDAGGDTVADVIVGDVALDVGFSTGSTGTISGTIDNLYASVDGDTVASDLVLTTQYAAAQGIPSTLATVSNTINVPGIGTQTLRTGSYSAAFGAEVSADDLPGVAINGDLLVTLGGTFTGPGAQGSTGTALGQLITNTSIGAYGGAGTHYTTKN